MLPDKDTINYSTKPRRFSHAKSVWKPFHIDEVKEPEFTQVGNNEILIGNEIDYDEAATWPYNPKQRTTIVICGGQGCGKSVLLKVIGIDNLHGRFGHPLLAFAPKPADFHRLTRPNRNPEHIKAMARYGITPMAYNPLFVVSKFLDLVGSYGKKSGNEITLNLQSLVKMDKDTRTAVVCKLLGDTSTTDAGYKIISELTMSDNMPTDVYMFLEKMDTLIQKQKSKPENVRILFENLIKTNKISNKYFDYAKAMNEHGIVVLEGTQASEDTLQGLSQGIFVNAAIQDVINARKEGRFKKIPVVIMGEASNYAGKKGICAGPMTSISTQYREVGSGAGVTSIVESQFLYELTPKIVSEAELILCPKITNSKDLEILNDRDCDTSVMYDLEADPSTRTYDWVAYGRNGINDYKIFRPIPTRSYMATT